MCRAFLPRSREPLLEIETDDEPGPTKRNILPILRGFRPGEKSVLMFWISGAPQMAQLTLRIQATIPSVGQLDCFLVFCPTFPV